MVVRCRAVLLLSTGVNVIGEEPVYHDCSPNQHNEEEGEIRHD